MKFSKVSLAAAMGLMLAAGMANAQDQGHGKVTFTGSIIDAPCSINPDSIDQTVGMGQISNVALKANGNTGTSVPRNFEIKLENCDVSTLKTVKTTFTGAEGATDGSLGITGTAKGASIILTNGDGQQSNSAKRLQRISCRKATTRCCFLLICRVMAHLQPSSRVILLLSQTLRWLTSKSGSTGLHTSAQAGV